MFRADLAREHPAAPDVEGLERWVLEVERGDVEALFLPPLAPRATPGPAVVIAHGNAELADDWVGRVEPYRAMGLAVLIPEYRGYGRSGGEPSEAGILADAAHFYDRMVDRPDVDPQRVLFHGYSLGGGVVAELSESRRAAALVLESTFTSASDLASRWMVPDFAVTDRFDTRAVLMRASIPVLIVHGVDDDVVPFQHAIELDRVGWDSRLVAFHAHHDDLPRGEVYWATIRAFLEENGLLGAAPSSTAPSTTAPSTTAPSTTAPSTTIQ
jgi:hypothetical protein